MTYQEAWSYLDRLQFFKIKLGLESMTGLLAELDRPQQQYPCIHIGGTNGKGSVGATLLAILRAAGYRAGLYTSPHLSSVRERFRLGDRYISRDEFAAISEKIIRILAGRQITYFEFTTALVLLWFAEVKVDIALLEVGLGGRLDATNVVTPLVSVITNIGLDHEQYLGTTVGEIAAEKAGIIKLDVPVVTGARQGEALAVIESKARELGCPVYLLQRDFTAELHRVEKGLWSYSGIKRNGEARMQLSDLPLPLRGAHQVDNAAQALAALEVIRSPFPVSETELRKGLNQVAWPGRLEEFRHAAPPPGRFLLDGAHNPDGARALKNALRDDFSYDRLILVWASMADKDIAGTLLEVAPLAAEIIFTRPESERSARPETLRDLLPGELRDRIRTSCTDSVRAALDLAMAAAEPDDLICVAGSLYLVGQARQRLLGELVNKP
ncbi:MAG TPA: bifunctional folylpolyglutamate synthase/dihydrofolate synthase [Desulfobulbaceae bacterium]|nr:bifunctional folylpolyglutamate synthase/dihydrofolate synthase [Desulfobulbaceae bacterium]